MKRLCSMKRRWPLDVLVALVDLRGLRESRALLVHGLRREQPGHLGRQVLEPHRAVIVEQRMEGVVADPGLVPQHVVAEVPDLLQHLADVVDRAVVGRELDAGQPERPLGLVALLVLHQRVRADLLAQDASRPTRPSRPRRSCRTDCARSAGRSGSRPPSPARPGAATCGCCGRTAPGRRAAASRW